MVINAFDSDDYETSIEDFPGYVGHTWDGELFPGPALEALENFDWYRYEGLVSASGQPRRLVLTISEGPRVLLVKPEDGIHDLLEQHPSIQVWCDEPAAGLGFFFTILDRANGEQLTLEIAALKSILEHDHLALKRSIAEPPIPRGPSTRAGAVWIIGDRFVAEPFATQLGELPAFDLSNYEVTGRYSQMQFDRMMDAYHRRFHCWPDE